MTPPEALNTTLALLAAFAAGASIAVLGNRVGRRSGRDKLSLLGLRPRHTATLITATTGGLIAVATLVISLALSGQMALLQGRVGEMQRRLQEITDEYEGMRRRGRLLLPARSVLALEAVPASLPEERVRALIRTVLGNAEARVRQAYYAKVAETQETPREPAGDLLSYDPREVRSTVDVLLAARVPQALEVQVPENAWLQGNQMLPVSVKIQAVSIFRVYREGDLVARVRLDPRDPDLMARLMEFVYTTVPAAARAARMPVNPISGRLDVRVGQSSALEWSSLLYRELQASAGPLEVQARASQDLYSLGRLEIRLEAPRLGLRVPAQTGP